MDSTAPQRVRIVAVTGAGTGIGRATARAFAPRAPTWSRSDGAALRERTAGRGNALSHPSGRSTREG
ncbi:hypothetical protein ACFO1B_08000 [Dactylosporangium siamense]|nr:hypothetical protein [Dactylosporangium siamense]